MFGASCPPFACLPNHVVGKSVIKRLRQMHPESNIVAVDYDPGASEVNQLNRIKLMISVARGGHACGVRGGDRAHARAARANRGGQAQGRCDQLALTQTQHAQLEIASNRELCVRELGEKDA